MNLRAWAEAAREFVTAATGGPWPGMQPQAQRLLEQFPLEPLQPGARAAPAPRPGAVDTSALAFPKPAGGPSKRGRRRDRRPVIRGIRFRVLGRTRGICEFRCALGGEPTEAHHVLGGSDRVEMETEYTLAGICETCHDRTEASPAWDRAQSLAWARRMAEAARPAAARGDAAAIADVAGFQQTAALLEARVALADAQARPLPPPKPQET